MSDGACAESSSTAVSDDAVAGTVTDLAAASSVLVGVTAADRGAIRRALPDGVEVVTLLDLRSLDEAARHVFAVDGRCVVLARRGPGGWDVRTTAGAWAPALPSPTVPSGAEPPPAPRVRSTPRPARDSWIGGGGAIGFPTLVAAFGTVRLGPVVGEVGLGAFLPLFIDAYARAGPVLALGRPPADAPAIAIGVLAGPMTWGTILNGWSGTSVVATLDRYRGRSGRTASLVRVTAGVDLITATYDINHGGAREFGWIPRIQLAVGAVACP